MEVRDDPPCMCSEYGPSQLPVLQKRDKTTKKKDNRIGKSALEKTIYVKLMCDAHTGEIRFPHHVCIY